MKTKNKSKITSGITAHSLEASFGSDVHAAVDFAKSECAAFPSGPRKPVLLDTHTSKEAADYSKQLAGYEKELEKHREKHKEAKEYNAEIFYQVELYIKEVSGFNRVIPADKKDKVWSKAWEEGHSNGYGEVYLCLIGLVDLFE